MQGDNTHLPFLGPCEACGKVSRNYNALAQHFRFKQDDAHQALKGRWLAWRGVYRATLRCRKCGDLFEVTEKSAKDAKRCSRCEGLRMTLSKRQYEALRFDMPADPRALAKDGGSKARWPVGYTPTVEVDTVYEQAVKVLSAGGGVRAVMRLGVPYPKAQELAARVLGDTTEYAAWVLNRKQSTIRDNREQARKSSGLEALFVSQLQGVGIEPCGRNEWMTLTIDGQRVRREADIKVLMASGRKVVILCDGEAFHGPKCLYSEPERKVADDRATALALFHRGYTVLRYSEGEIRQGLALQHLQGVLHSNLHLYRNWHPYEEVLGSPIRSVRP